MLLTLTLTATSGNIFTSTPKEEHFANADCTGAVTVELKGTALRVAISCALFVGTFLRSLIFTLSNTTQRHLTETAALSDTARTRGQKTERTKKNSLETFDL